MHHTTPHEIQPLMFLVIVDKTPISSDLSPDLSSNPLSDKDLNGSLLGKLLY